MEESRVEALSEVARAELRYLYEISKLVEKPSISLEEILRGTNDLLPAAWGYPDVTCSRIVFENLEFKTKNFKETKWKQQSEIKVYGKKAGVVEVYYLKEKPTIAESLFFKEERDLIYAVAERLGRIIERRRLEEKFSEFKERFRNFYESIPDALAIYIGKEGHLIEYNKGLKKRYGYSDEELKDKKFLDFVHPDYHAMLIEEYRKEHSEEELPFICEINGITKKGESFPMEISVGPYKKKGRVIGINVMHRDITERKKAEKKLKATLENMQILNEKLKVVGKLTRHDVRNKLVAVNMYVYLAKKKLTAGDKVSEYLGEIEAIIKQTERIFDFARIYEKLGIEELTYIDAEKTLKEAVTLFSELQGIKIVNDCKGLTVLADSLLKQLFYNVVHNSLKHGEKVSKIRVYHEDAGKDRLKLVYEDDGIGIPKAEKEKIFKEGYGKGMGYGLYLIRKICEVYGWTIKEKGKPGEGAQFTITIPRINENGKIAYRLN